MKRFRAWAVASVSIVVVLLMLIPMTAIGGKGKENKSKKPGNAAKVNGTAISSKDFDWEMTLYTKQYEARGMQMTDEIQKQARTEVLNEMINRELIYQQTQKKGIKIKPEDVNKKIDEIKQRFPDQKQFETTLANMNMSEAKLKGQIEQRLAITNLIDQEIAPKVNITDEAAKAFYKDNPRLFERPEEVHAQHILIKVPENATDKQKAEARKKLTEIKKRADAGEDFAKLAKENSEGPSSQNGGDLGYFSRGKMVPAFEKAAFDLKNNQISDIVETNFGFHIIKALDHREAQTLSFEEVQPKIVANLRNQGIQKEIEKYVAELRKTAKIETFIE